MLYDVSTESGEDQPLLVTPDIADVTGPIPFGGRGAGALHKQGGCDWL